jgi:hypothetical protein
MNFSRRENKNTHSPLREKYKVITLSEKEIINENKMKVNANRIRSRFLIDMSNELKEKKKLSNTKINHKTIIDAEKEFNKVNNNFVEVKGEMFYCCGKISNRFYNSLDKKGKNVKDNYTSSNNYDNKKNENTQNMRIPVRLKIKKRSITERKIKIFSQKEKHDHCYLNMTEQSLKAFYNLQNLCNQIKSQEEELMPPNKANEIREIANRQTKKSSLMELSLEINIENNKLKFKRESKTKEVERRYSVPKREKSKNLFNLIQCKSYII